LRALTDGKERTEEFYSYAWAKDPALAAEVASLYVDQFMALEQGFLRGQFRAEDVERLDPPVLAELQGKGYFQDVDDGKPKAIRVGSGIQLTDSGMEMLRKHLALFDTKDKAAALIGAFGGELTPDKTKFPEMGNTSPRDLVLERAWNDFELIGFIEGAAWLL